MIARRPLHGVTAMARVRQLLRSCRGQALAEFAVVFPVQLLVTLGIVQLALVLVARDVVEYAAHAAARSELVGEDPHRAASIICTPVVGTSLGRREVRYEPALPAPASDGVVRVGTSIDFPEWKGPMPPADAIVLDGATDIVLPGWGRLEYSRYSLVKTFVNVIHDVRDNAFDYVEVQVLHEYELPIPMVNWIFSTHRVGGAPHMGIVRTARVPKMWANAVEGDPHGEIPPLPRRSP